ncbi:hypothetical protein BDZ88DRAFT_272978 [Geranomyces variabilis]|nr:hypothetical protein BDZ88DRAFT_272978 [Geranomyces variabilis]
MSRLPLAQSFSVPQPMATSAASHPPTPSSSANYECEYLTTDHSATLQIFFGGLIVTALAFCVIVLPLTYCLARRSLNSRAASTPSSTKINSSRRSEWLRRALFIIAALGIQVGLVPILLSVIPSHEPGPLDCVDCEDPRPAFYFHRALPACIALQVTAAAAVGGCWAYATMWATHRPPASL